MKPILFNTEMVEAILKGRKTQTRRIVKGLEHIPGTVYGCDLSPEDKGNLQLWDFMYGYTYPGLCVDCSRTIKAPYKAGEILYVRETWANCSWDKDKPEYVYKASDETWIEDRVIWHPSIHMPKAAARIFLNVTNIRAERLQDAEEYDIEQEGYMGCPDEHTIYFPEGGAEPCFNVEGECPCHGWYCSHSLAEGFGKDVWDKTIKPADLPIYGWDANPWVWVIEFERISKEAAYVS